MGKVAFVTGANGITGSYILEHLSNQPWSEWSELIATSRSSLEIIATDDRIKFIPLDFTKPPAELISEMRTICSKVTHAFFSSYIHDDDFAQLNVKNAGIFEHFLDSITAVAPALEAVVLQTGGKYYNVHLGPVPSPIREEQPRRETPMGNFYFAQEDYLIAKQKEFNKWRWTVIRPEAIIGCTARPNGMNAALCILLYLLVHKELGIQAKMPTNQIYWEGYDNISDARLVADMSVWAATTPSAGNEAFNVANGDFFCWQYFWPRLAQYVGAEASSDQVFEKPRPARGETQIELKFQDWAEENQAVWDEMCDVAGFADAKRTFSECNWPFQTWVFQRGWNSTLSINKARRFGWMGHRDSFESFTEAFDRFVEVGQVPPFRG